MTPSVYITIALLVVYPTEAKLVDSPHNVDLINNTSLTSSVNNMPKTGVYCAGSTEWLLQKVQVIAENQVIIFYPHEESGLPQSFPCHYEAQAKEADYPIKLVDGYQDLIDHSDGYYTSSIIDRIELEDSTIWVPNHELVYESFSPKGC